MGTVPMMVMMVRLGVGVVVVMAPSLVYMFGMAWALRTIKARANLSMIMVLNVNR